MLWVDWRSLFEYKQKDIALNYHVQASQSNEDHYSIHLSYRINSYEHIGTTCESIRFEK